MIIKLFTFLLCTFFLIKAQQQMSAMSSKTQFPTQPGMQPSSMQTPQTIHPPVQPTMPVQPPIHSGMPSDQLRREQELKRQQEEFQKRQLDWQKREEEKRKKEEETIKKKQQEEKEKIEKEFFLKIDTIGLEDEGNWLLKRIWWEQAEQLFEKIINVNDQIIQIQIIYLNKRNKIDKHIDQQFRKLGYDQGELRQLIDFLLAEISKERTIEGLDVHERQLLELLKEKGGELEKLRNDLDVLAKDDETLDGIIDQLAQQVSKARDYEKQAWNDFKEIGRVLNDKKAKTLYYEMDTDLKNIQAIYGHLSGQLMNFLNNLSKKIYDLSSSVNSQMDILRKEGISIKDQVEELRKAEKLQEEQKNKIEKEHIEKVKPKPRLKPKGWFESIIDWFKSFFK